MGRGGIHNINNLFTQSLANLVNSRLDAKIHSWVPNQEAWFPEIFEDLPLAQLSESVLCKG